jgi:hypothetical protein
MLGVPASPGLLGWLLLVLGVAVAAGAAATQARRLRAMDLVTLAATVSLIVTAGALPYVSWRFVTDLRVTTRLHGYDAEAAGPVQAYLPGYFLDSARGLIPARATYATAVGESVPWARARAAFPSLALQTLFPRRSVDDLRRADFLVSWGIPPNRIAPVSRVWVARRRAGLYPPVYVARLQH